MSFFRLTPQVDPIKMASLCWSEVKFYGKQQEVIYSVEENDETFCVAAHQTGKDFVAGFIVLRFFLCHPTCRVITTSVKDDHLRVLWGEIGRYIETCRNDTIFGPLKAKEGGPLIVKHRELRKLVPYNRYDPLKPTGTVLNRPYEPGDKVVECKYSYCLGMVSEKGEGLAGHHAPATLLVVDEASGVDPIVLERCSSWAKKILVIGNPYGPKSSWFGKACSGGDLEKNTGRNVFKEFTVEY